MCKILFRKWKDLKSTYAAEMLKGKFPECGIKYTSKHGEGLVLANHNVTDIDMVRQKACAAAMDSDISHVFVIPKKVAKAVGL